MQNVKRLDFQFIGKNVKTTPQGFLIIPAFTARTGLQTYRTEDGKTIVEYRSESEVFSEQSMDSLRTAAVTNKHPIKMVNPKNARDLIVGHTDGFIEKVTGEDGESYLKTNVVITHQDAIDAILNGRVELSNGYHTDLEFTSGEYKGQKYDAIQKNIINNHIALVDRARGGRNVRLRLDSKDAFIEGETMKVTIKGKEFDVSEDVAIAINDALGELTNVKKDSDKDKETIKTITAENGKLTAKVDSLTSDLEKEKAIPKTTKLDGEEFETAVKERISVLDFGKKVLDESIKLDGMSNLEIKKAIIKADSETVDEKKLENEVYVNARFDHIQETYKDVDAANKKVAKAINGQKDKTKTDGEETYLTPDQKREQAMAQAVKDSTESQIEGSVKAEK